VNEEKGRREYHNRSQMLLAARQRRMTTARPDSLFTALVKLARVPWTVGTLGSESALLDCCESWRRCQQGRAGHEGEKCGEISAYFRYDIELNGKVCIGAYTNSLILMGRSDDLSAPFGSGSNGGPEWNR
jgi:hypothetical protein